MKKIVGILAAAALATSVFAADVSAKVLLNGELLNVAGSNVSAASINHNPDQAWNPVFKLAVSGDNYGAETSFYTTAWDSDKGWRLASKTMKIWFKPIDVLKIQVGNVDAATFNETIGYSKMMNYDEWGYQVEFASNGFTLNVGLHSPNAGDSWLYTTAAGKTKVRGIGAKVGYSADFGNIIAYFNFNGSASVGEAPNTVAANAIDLAAGYKNKFGDLSIFADAGMKMTLPEVGDAGIGIYGDFDVNYAKDALWAEAYALFSMKDVKATTDPIAVKTIAKISYQLDPCKVYAYFEDNNWAASTFGATFKFGATGSVGAASWDVAAQIGVASTTTFSIPVEFKVEF